MKRTIYFPLLLLSFGLLALPARSQTNGKTILVEKITSVGCPSCPWGSYILDSLEQDDPGITVVAVHVHDQWHIDSLRCADGDTIVDVYKWGHPTAMVDRVKFSGQNDVAMSSMFWKSKIAERKLAPVEVTLGASSTYDMSSRELTVQLSGNTLWALQGDVRVNLYVVEGDVVGNGLGFDQLNGYNNVATSPLYGLGDPIVGYSHKWVLRDMLGGPWGLPGVVSTPASAGSFFSHAFTYTLDPKWNEANVHLVAVVQRYHPDPLQRIVLNAVKLGLNESVLADVDEVLEQEKGIAVYPQPMVNEAWVRIPGSNAREIRIYDLQGRLLRSEALAAGEGLHYLERGDLKPGILVLQLWSGNEVIGHQKLILR